MSCPLREIWPPALEVLVLRSFTKAPYELLRLAPGKGLIFKICFLCALALAKDVSELRTSQQFLDNSYRFIFP